MGSSAGLALLEFPKDANLPPLEVLLTVDEETGLTGAKALDNSKLQLSGKQAHRLLRSCHNCTYSGSMHQ